MEATAVTVALPYPEPVLSNFTASPCATFDKSGDWSGQWMVWDMYQPLPPKPVFLGTMEEAGGVADALNRRRSTKE